MEKNKRINISVYSQGGLTSAGLYYRFYQYLRELDVDVRYNKQIPDKIYKKCMPLAFKPLFIQIGIAILVVFRVSIQLIRDVYNSPRFLIISRTFINRWYPAIFNIMLRIIKKKGCTIIWDFDDNIKPREISPARFESLSYLADVIIVASPYLIESIKNEYHDKILHLPTTDGDLFPKISLSVINKRKNEYDSKIRLLWVGTAYGLRYVEAILPNIEKAALKIKELEKDVIFTVISNGVVDYHSKYFTLENVRWSREAAVEAFLDSHIGLMPLLNTEFEKGKGGFKLIQYLSVGLPSLASSIGINKDILEHGGGTAIDELNSLVWEKEIVRLSTDKDLWESTSNDAINNYMRNYNYSSNLNVWKNILLK